MSEDYYIYYQVPAKDGALLQQRVGSLQRRLHAQLGIACALKRRQHGKDGQDTWMEVYLAAPEGFEQALARELQAAQVQELIDGDRHVEHFLDVLSCA